MEATEQFKSIGEAFETLFDSGKRAEYDFEMNVTAVEVDADVPEANVPPDADCDMQAQREDSDVMETASDHGFSDQEDPFGHGGGHEYENWSDANNHCDICDDGNCGVKAHVAARKAQFDLRQSAPIEPMVDTASHVSEQVLGGVNEVGSNHGYGSSWQREGNAVLAEEVVGDRSDMVMTETTLPKLNSTGIRISSKRNGCASCSGPCGPLRCFRTVSTEPDCLGSAPQPDAADVLRAAVARMRAPRAESAPGVSPVGVKRRFDNARHTESRFDGRTKRAKAVQELPRNFGMVPTWLSVNPQIGNVAIHASHVPHLGWYRGLTWCWKCGSFAVAVPSLLRRECTGPGTHGNLQLARLRKGQTPRNEVPWPLDEA